MAKSSQISGVPSKWRSRLKLAVSLQNGEVTSNCGFPSKWRSRLKIAEPL